MKSWKKIVDLIRTSYIMEENEESETFTYFQHNGNWY